MFSLAAGRKIEYFFKARAAQEYSDLIVRCSASARTVLLLFEKMEKLKSCKAKSDLI